MTAGGEGSAHRVGGGRRFEHLDMLRGVAALLVCMGHARGSALADYSALPGARLIWAPFYLLTGLGHQAVIVFFALSGFLVGGRALREIARESWNPPDYAVQRFTRLWTTLVPALAMTALLDWIGRDVLGLAGYKGEFWALLSSGPPARGGVDRSVVTFFGNVVFLQTIAVPTFGSNGPLWSLANEFWYYFAIPFGWLAIRGGVRPAARAAAGGFAFGAAVLLPVEMVAFGSIWLIGALAYLAGPLVAAQSKRGFTFLVGVVLVALATTLALSIRGDGLAADVGLGVACAVALPCLARLPNLQGVYGSVAFWLSEMSFTLYVSHFPLLALIWFGLLAPTQFAPGLAGIASWAFLIAAALAYSAATWWLFERNTGRVRRWAQRRLRITTGQA